jgi:hypothetical protein
MKAEYIQNGSDAVYNASTQAGIALSTALSTTQTGFTLTNPFNSGYNLILLQVFITPTTIPAATASIVLTANIATAASSTAVIQTTALTVRNAKLGAALQSVALASSATTLPAAPVVIAPLGGIAGTTDVQSPSTIISNLDGGFVITPGSAVSVNSLTTAITAIIAMNWAEVPAF